MSSARILSPLVLLRAASWRAPRCTPAAVLYPSFATNNSPPLAAHALARHLPEVPPPTNNTAMKQPPGSQATTGPPAVPEAAAPAPAPAFARKKPRPQDKQAALQRRLARRIKTYSSPNAELSAAWWRAEDEKYGGPGWVEQLAPRSVPVAHAMRKHLHAWPTHLEAAYGPSAGQEAVRQSKELRSDWQDLNTRFKATRHRVVALRQRYKVIAEKIDCLDTQVAVVLQRLSYYDDMEVQFGAGWGRVADEQRLTAKALRIAGSKEYKKLHRRGLSIFWRGERLVSDVERSLALLRWYDELEKEHGHEWEQTAVGAQARWTQDWDAANPLPGILGGSRKWIRARVLSSMAAE